MKKTKVHKQISFGINTSDHCCGILVVGGFSEDTGHYDWLTDRNTHVKIFRTQEDQVTDFSKRFEKNLIEYILDGNNHEGQYILQASLVEKYESAGFATMTEGQFPQLRKWFEENDWKLAYRWKNMNSGNTVVLYQKCLTNKAIHELAEKLGLEEELESCDNGW
jgi:hypothetical protein